MFLLPDSKATLVYGSPLPLSFLAWLSGPLTIWPSPAFHIFFPLHSFTLSGLWWYSVAQSCLALCDPMDCSPPGSSVHGISQAMENGLPLLEWVAISFFRGSSSPKDQTHISCTAGRFFTTEPPGKQFFFFGIGTNKLSSKNPNNLSL